MIDVQPLGQQQMLRRHHIVVVIVREMRMQPVARLRRPAVPDVVRQHDVILRRIQQLSRSKQHAGKIRRQKLRARPARSVHDQHRVVHVPLRIAMRRAQRSVVQLHLRQRFARPEMKIVRQIVPLLHRRTRLCNAPSRTHRQSRNRDRPQHFRHRPS